MIYICSFVTIITWLDVLNYADKIFMITSADPVEKYV